MSKIRLGIFGWPARHSKSPAMHEAAGRAVGLDIRYEIFEVEPAHFEAKVQAERERGLVGFNVTLPHKAAALAMVDEATPAARAIGAVNTVKCAAAVMHGDNTDAPGVVRSVEEAGFVVQGARVVVLGAGGAARAAVVGLANAGAASVTVLARRHERAVALVHEVRLDDGAPLAAGALGKLEDAFAQCDLLVQATSATLDGNPDADAFAAALPLEVMPKHAAVVDLVYKPLVTTVLERADELGLKTIDGLGMLLHQGAIAFEQWTGVPAPLDVMRAALQAT